MDIHGLDIHVSRENTVQLKGWHKRHGARQVHDYDQKREDSGDLLMMELYIDSEALYIHNEILLAFYSRQRENLKREKNGMFLGNEGRKQSGRRKQSGTSSLGYNYKERCEHLIPNPITIGLPYTQLIIIKIFKVYTEICITLIPSNYKYRTAMKIVIRESWLVISIATIYSSVSRTVNQHQL